MTSKLKEEDISIVNHRRLVAYIGQNREMVKTVRAKLYTSDSDAEHWLYSDIEGFLCFITDYEKKSRYFVIYSFINYEKLFEIELYLNFNQYYTVLSEDFHCFEFAQGFIGIKFETGDSASMFKIIVNKFDDKLLSMIMMGDMVKKDKRDLVKKNIKHLKERFTSKNIYDENYIEDGLFIIKPRYFELLGNISFCREKKEFIINDEEVKQLFKDAGFKKKDMKDTKFALEIFKKMIQTLENIDTNSSDINFKRIHKINRKLDQNLNKNFDLANISQSESVLLNNSDSKNTILIGNTTNIPTTNKIPNIPKIPVNIAKNIPKIPANIKIPIIPKINTPSEPTNTDSDISPQKRREDELKNLVLKKAEYKEEEVLDSHTQMKRAIEKGVQLTKIAQQEQKKITLNDKTILSAALSLALEQRGKDMKNDKKEEDEDSDWSE